MLSWRYCSAAAEHLAALKRHILYTSQRADGLLQIVGVQIGGGLKPVLLGGRVLAPALPARS